MHVRLYTETESQKQILIGKGGSMVREIGRTARPFVEQLLGHAVYLQLQVKAVAEVAAQPDDARAARALASDRREQLPEPLAVGVAPDRLECALGGLLGRDERLAGDPAPESVSVTSARRASRGFDSRPTSPIRSSGPSCRATPDGVTPRREASSARRSFSPAHRAARAGGRGRRG